MIAIVELIDRKQAESLSDITIKYKQIDRGIILGDTTIAHRIKERWYDDEGDRLREKPKNNPMDSYKYQFESDIPKWSYDLRWFDDAIDTFLDRKQDQDAKKEIRSSHID